MWKKAGNCWEIILELLFSEGQFSELNEGTDFWLSRLIGKDRREMSLHDGQQLVRVGCRYSCVVSIGSLCCTPLNTNGIVLLQRTVAIKRVRY